MKTIGVRALRENPGVLTKFANEGEYLLVTNRNVPVSLSVPFDDDLLNSGVHVSVAIKLFDDNVLTLTKAAQLAKMPVESFLMQLSVLGIDVVDQNEESLLEDLEAL
ncbi:MAG: hypothetical protein HOM11_08500 [Methylococcales bacterium]|jgi:predicted HTH domain antitoxin|nr:hypothetical protein [Methylococcales bacterium]MBT7445239.1 hypothetical protein [Methylococcales bacterium]